MNKELKNLFNGYINNQNDKKNLENLYEKQASLLEQENNKLKEASTKYAKTWIDESSKKIRDIIKENTDNLKMLIEMGMIEKDYHSLILTGTDEGYVMSCDWFFSESNPAIVITPYDFMVGNILNDTIYNTINDLNKDILVYYQRITNYKNMVEQGIQLDGSQISDMKNAIAGLKNCVDLEKQIMRNSVLNGIPIYIDCKDYNVTFDMDTYSGYYKKATQLDIAQNFKKIETNLKEHIEDFYKPLMACFMVDYIQDKLDIDKIRDKITNINTDIKEKEKQLNNLANQDREKFISERIKEIYKEHIIPDINEKLCKVTSDNFVKSEGKENLYTIRLPMSNDAKNQLSFLFRLSQNITGAETYIPFIDKQLDNCYYNITYEYEKDDDIGCGLKYAGGYYDIGLYFEYDNGQSMEDLTFFDVFTEEYTNIGLNDATVWYNKEYNNLMMNQILGELGIYKTNKQDMLSELEKEERE